MSEPAPRSTGSASPNLVLFVLSAVMMLNIIDRQMLSILIDPIKQELRLSDAAMGLLTGTSFALLHVLAMIPIASWADRRSRRDLIAWGLGVWSLLTVMTGLARSFAEIFVVRLGLGVGEATAVPASHSIVSDYFPLERRATALSMLVVAGPVGQTLAFAVGGWVNEFFGWRAVFFVFGIPGVLLALAVRRVIREPERGAADGSAGAWSALSVRDALAHLVGLRAYRQLALAAALAAVANYALLIWAAPLWMRLFGMGTGEVGTALAVATGPSTIAGVVASGRLADRFARRDVRWLVWIPAIACGLSFPLGVGFVLAPGLPLATGLLAATTFTGAMIIPPIFAAVQSVVWPNARAMASAWVSLLLTAFGLGLGPPLVGWAADVWTAEYGDGALRPALLAAMPCFGWAAAHLLWASRSLADEIGARSMDR